MSATVVNSPNFEHWQSYTVHCHDLCRW